MTKLLRYSWAVLLALLWLHTPSPSEALDEWAYGTTTTASSSITGTPAALGTSTINSLACATVVTATATGATTSDTIAWSFNADVSGVTGYAPATAGGLIIYDYPTANTVNFKVCNPTGSPITPGAVTLNWIIPR